MREKYGILSADLPVRREHTECEAIIMIPGGGTNSNKPHWESADLQHLIPTKDRIWKIGFGVRVTGETYKQLVKYFLAHHRLRIGGIKLYR